MPSRRYIVVTVGIVLLLLVTPVVVFLVAPMTYHGLIAKLVRDASGLEVIHEALEVDLFPLEIRGKQLVITNPQTDVEGPLVSANQYTLTIDPQRWWNKAPSWWRLSGNGVVITAARNAQGDANWDLPVKGNQPPPVANDKNAARNPKASKPWQHFSSVDIEEMDFIRINPEGTHHLDIAHVLLINDQGESLKLDLQGQLKQQPLTVEGTFPLPGSHQAGEIKLRANGLGVEITADGTVGSDGMVPAQADFQLASENLTDIGHLLDMNLVALVPLRIEGKFSSSGPDHYSLDINGRVAERPLILIADVVSTDDRTELNNLKFKLGKSDLSGDISIDTQGRNLTANISSDRLWVKELLTLAGEEPSKPHQKDTNFLQSLSAWNFDTQFKVAALHLQQGTVGNLDLQLKGQDGEIHALAELDHLNLKDTQIIADRQETGRATGSVSADSWAVNEPVNIEGTLRFDTVSDSDSNNIRLELASNTDGVSVQLEGVLSADGRDIQSGNLVAEINHFSAFPNIDSNTAIIQQLLPMKLTLSAEPDSAGLRIDTVRMELEDSVVSGKLFINQEQTPVHIEGELSSTLVDLNRIRASGAADTPEQEIQNVDLIPDDPIDWHWLEAISLDLELVLEKVLLNETVFRNVKFGSQLKDGALLIDPVVAELPKGGIQGRASIQLHGDSVAWESSLVIVGLAPADLGLTDKGMIDGGLTDLLYNLNSHGQSLQEFASNLNGEMALETTSATIRKDLFNLIGSDLLMQLVEALNPFDPEDGKTILECAAGYLIAEEGVLSSDEKIVIETDDMKIRGTAKIVLQDESMEIDFVPSARKGIGLGIGSIASMVRIGGTLAKPTLETDASGVIKAGASAGAAIVTSGLSLLAQGLFDIVQNSGGTKCGHIFDNVPETEIPASIEPTER